MASTNQSTFYKQAEVKFLNAKTDEERIEYLEEMIRECPKHKSSEKMLANLKTRLIKLKEKAERAQKTKGSSKQGIKKEDMQVVIIGKTNSGKSSLLNLLTNASPIIADYEFTTKQPLIGVMNYQEVNIQLVDIPAIESEYYDRGIVNTSDSILILVKKLEEIKEIENKLLKAIGRKIIVFNKIDLLSENEKRKISAFLQSKKYNFVLISSLTGENVNELKEKIFKSFSKIRVYTKEPGKPPSSKPIILNPNSTVEDVAEKIFHGFSKQVEESRITGPSSKFPNQKVGLKHILKDLDIIEFKTR